ncbi:MAG: AAA family ATPase [Candidatus Firestonebacteria bacterium RIFOXYC2_FULL_39_67]|nr:MAG: AAA family ATPase [Candidatus Firestonebacteria bacterium RIFOXYD2_FULL_39_29]OGF57008.1 MAG: AAA family ATPase [Candidatus Firestonebacteria bacterium RIFOXYC2_FULL_39_67]
MDKLESKQDLELVLKLSKVNAEIKLQLKKVIVGQEKVIEEVLISLFCKGHCLLVGVPGLAKTLLIESISKILDLKFNRIQFTPDLMPSDITGTEVIQQDKAGERSFRFIKGPVFANIVLADEINRTPPKTQSALLQAMQENKVSAGGQTHSLPLPFFVLATQNPIEQEGTYPLPEAQLDRFFFNIAVKYPTRDEEKDIVRQTTGAVDYELQPVLNAEEIIVMQELVRRVPVSDYVIDYAIDLVAKSRPQEVTSPDYVKEMLVWGASPRASQALIIGAKAKAVISGRFAASVSDVAAVAPEVLRHRLVLSFKAQADGVTTDQIVTRLLDTVKPG